MLIGKLCDVLVIATLLWVGRSGFRILVGEIHFFHIQNVQIDRGAHIHPPVHYVSGKVAGP